MSWWSLGLFARRASWIRAACGRARGRRRWLFRHGSRPVLDGAGRGRRLHSLRRDVWIHIVDKSDPLGGHITFLLPLAEPRDCA